MNSTPQRVKPNNHHHLELIVVTVIGALLGLFVANVYDTNIVAGIIVGVMIGVIFAADLTRRARDM